jgi:hypothetical protein
MNYLILELIAVSFFPMKSLAQPVTYPAARVRVDSVQVAANRAPEKAIDELTDFSFNQVHLHLNRRKIRSDETQYIKEWAAIKKVVSDDNLVDEKKCFESLDYEWRLSQYDEQGRKELLFSSPVLNKVADAVFYARHPELGYRKVPPGETRLALEWSKIRQAVGLLHPCY